jgi:hypothetical protein
LDADGIRWGANINRFYYKNPLKHQLDGLIVRFSGFPCVGVREHCPQRKIVSVHNVVGFQAKRMRVARTAQRRGVIGSTDGEASALPRQE